MSRLCHHSFFIIFNRIVPKQYQRLLKEADKYFIAEKMRRVSENADYALILDGQKLIDLHICRFKVQAAARCRNEWYLSHRRKTEKTFGLVKKYDK